MFTRIVEILGEIIKFLHNIRHVQDMTRREDVLEVAHSAEAMQLRRGVVVHCVLLSLCIHCTAYVPVFTNR